MLHIANLYFKRTMLRESKPKTFHSKINFKTSLQNETICPGVLTLVKAWCYWLFLERNNNFCDGGYTLAINIFAALVTIEAGIKEY